MSEQPAADGQILLSPPGPALVTERPVRRSRKAARVLGHIAVVIVILAVIAAAFWLSYNPVRDIARDAGVQAQLVRIYPGILDAVFLVACACAVMLRNARWWYQLYARLSVLVTAAVISAANVYHVTGLQLPRRTMNGIIWALPWALVLLAFSLWLTTLQHRKPDDDADETEPMAVEADETARVGRAAAARGLAAVGFGAAAEAREAATAAAPAAAEAAAEPEKESEARGAQETAETSEPVPADPDRPDRPDRPDEATRVPTLQAASNEA